MPQLRLHAAAAGTGRLGDHQGVVRADDAQVEPVDPAGGGRGAAPAVLGDVLAARALKAGAFGFLFKDTLRADLVNTVRSAYAGLKRIPEELQVKWPSIPVTIS